MRRAVDKPLTFWSARVSADEKQEFKNLLPIHGAQTACFNLALEKFCDLAQAASKETLAEIHDDIQRHLREEIRSGATEELSINVSTSLYITFNEFFPEQGATSWFLRRTLKALNQQLETFVLDERVELAIRSILRETKQDA